MKRFLVLLVTLGIVAGCAPTPKLQLGGIGDTSWQLVKYQGGNGAVQTPDDKTKYTLAFTNDGYVNARFDCNRGRGTWILTGRNELRIGPIALTRAVCPPGSMHDQIVKQLPLIKGYEVKNGHLYLALMADTGSYEFEPARQ